MALIHHPIFLDLQGRPCVVVGAGSVGRPKVEGLVAAGADVTVVAPDAAERLADLVAAGRVTVMSRSYREGDLEGTLLAVAATDDPEVNAAVQQEGRRRGCLVNVVDTLPLCDFITPSVVRRGDLTVAISTCGRAPAYAARLRRELEATLDEGPATLLRRSRFWRRRILRNGMDSAARRAAWRTLVTGELGGPLPPDWEHPVPVPEVASPWREELGIVGVDMLHGSAEIAARVATALRAPGDVHDALRGRLGPGADIAVVGGEERREIWHASPDVSATAALLLAWLAERADLPLDDLEEHGFSFTGGEALAHALATAAGLRGIVPGTPSPPQVLAEAHDRGSLVARLLDAAGGAAGDAGEASGGNLLELALHAVGSRISPEVPAGLLLLGEVHAHEDPRPGRLAPVSAEEAAVPTAARRGPLVVVSAGPQRVSPDTVNGWLGAGWARLWLVDLALPPSVEPELAERTRVTLWDLDDLADATPRSARDASVLAPGRAAVERHLARLLGAR